jgi:hypothetical protein
VENFCKPFDFDDPDKDLTGIAFLIVCDMLLTGFDAPVEQVMYIDKRLREHNLLQAIARVNRVATNKHRGFIVDYIGLANHPTQALSIKVGVTPQAIDVRELGYRWASCSPNGNLAFHWKCMMAPQTIIDYIVVHELCHLHHLDHSDACWNEVDKVLPSFAERRDWLSKHGAGLDI